MKNLPIISLFILCLFSCSSFGPRNSDSYVIRYVDLQRVYGFAEKHVGSVKSVESEVEQHDSNRKRIYGKIKTAISNVARRHDADFILNTGDAVLYSRTAYDITDDVIREYKKLTDISSPDIK